METYSVSVSCVGPAWSLDRVTDRTGIGQAVCEQNWKRVLEEATDDSHCLFIDDVPFNVTTAIAYLYIMDKTFRKQETLDVLKRTTKRCKLKTGRRHGKTFVVYAHLFPPEILKILF